MCDINGVIKCCGESPSFLSCDCDPNIYCDCVEKIECHKCGRVVWGVDEESIEEWNNRFSYQDSEDYHGREINKNRIKK
jgi:hypothetical protein